MRRGKPPAPRAPNFRGKGPLLPTVVQSARTGEVLGVAYSDAESWAKLRATGELYLHSRSRDALWRKGERSGHTASVIATAVDCDADSLLVRVLPSGPYCHTGRPTCFATDSGTAVAPVLPELERIIADRRRRPEPGSYTSELLGDTDRRLKKVGEEATEVVVAAARGDRPGVLRESADLVFHLLVVLGALDLRWEEVEGVLRARRRRNDGAVDHRPGPPPPPTSPDRRDAERRREGRAPTLAPRVRGHARAVTQGPARPRGEAGKGRPRPRRSRSRPPDPGTR